MRLVGYTQDEVAGGTKTAQACYNFDKNNFNRTERGTNRGASADFKGTTDPYECYPVVEFCLQKKIPDAQLHVINPSLKASLFGNRDIVRDERLSIDSDLTDDFSTSATISSSLINPTTHRSSTTALLKTIGG